MDHEMPPEIGSRFGDLSELPQELVQQIPAIRMDPQEQQILDLVRNFDGVASVDEILVGIYRITGVVEDRKKIAGKLYRMVQSRPPMLQSVEGKRGIYRLP